MLAAFLRALDVPSDRVPIEVSEATAMYRSCWAGRPTLVFLDNAHDADHVRPLLPGSGAGMVVITSRNELAGLAAFDGIAAVPLDVPPADEAARLLVVALGEPGTRDQDPRRSWPNYAPGCRWRCASPLPRPRSSARWRSPS